MKKSLYHEIGGLSTDYARHYQDVDLCLKIRNEGLSIICASNVRLIHHESISRKTEGYDLGDRAILIDRWHNPITNPDPFYNVNLSLDRLDYSLE